MPIWNAISLVFVITALTGCMAAARSDRSGEGPKFSGAALQAADPAVVFANANRDGEIGYREGYFGEGEDRLHFVEAGEGPLIILYHGFPSFWYSWFDQMEVLKGSYRVVAVDALGSGRSAKPQDLEPFAIASLAAQLDRLSRHLGGDEKYILIGHDWGSVLALSYAQAYPDRLHKVVGMSAPPFNLMLDFLKNSPEQRKRSQYMQNMRAVTLEMLKAENTAKTIAQQSYKSLSDRGDLSPQEVALFHAALDDPERINAAMNWYRANIPLIEQISDEDQWPVSNAKIMVPALFIWGEADQIFVPELIDKTSSYGTDWTTVRLPGINHWTSMQQPEMANRAILDFLGK